MREMEVKKALQESEAESIFSDSSGEETGGFWDQLVDSLGSHPSRSLGLLMVWLSTVVLCLKFGFIDHSDYTLIDTLYLTSQILTTVGYGDMPLPHTDSGYIGMTIVILSCLMVIAQIVTAAASVLVAAEKDLMEKAVRHAEKHKAKLHLKVSEQPVSPNTSRRREFLSAALAWCSLVLIWALFFSFYPGEDKHFIRALYFGVVTMTTVGFGDVKALTQGGRLFAAVGMIVGAAAFAVMVGKFTWYSYHFFNELSIKRVDRQSLERMLEFKRSHQSASPDAMREYANKLAEAHAKEGILGIQRVVAERISRSDFQAFMLMDMGVIDAEVINMINDQFDKLDQTGEGYIDEADIQAAHDSSP